MKTLIIFVSFLATTSISIAQKVKTENVPSPILKVFNAKFTNVTKVKWSLEKANVYEAEFKQEGAKKSANFKSDGTWLETEVEIKVSQLPQEVVDALNKKYAKYKIKEAEQAESREISKYFAVIIELGEKEIDVDIKPNGEIIKAEEVKEEEKD